MSFDQPRAPIVIDRVLPDPSVVRELLVRGAPYWTVQRYVKNLSEMAALSDAGKRGRKNRPMFIAPWFRGDWAYDEPLVDGTEVFLGHEGFRAAAQHMFEGGVIVPQIVYVNLNPPIAQVDPGHVDGTADRPATRPQLRRCTERNVPARAHRVGVTQEEQRQSAPSLRSLPQKRSGIGGLEGWRVSPTRIV